MNELKMMGNKKEGRKVERHLLLTLYAGPWDTSSSLSLGFGGAGRSRPSQQGIHAVMQSGNIIGGTRASLNAPLTSASMTHA